MADARQRRFDVVLVWKLDRFGRSVVHCVSGIQELASLGVRFIATSQGLDTDESNPASKLLLHILAAVAQFERELIRERTIAGIRVAQANGKHVGRPKRVFRRDELVGLRENGQSWRAIASQLGIPVMTALDAYRECTETVAKNGIGQSGKQRANRAVCEVYESLRLPYTGWPDYRTNPALAGRCVGSNKATVGGGPNAGYAFARIDK